MNDEFGLDTDMNTWENQGEDFSASPSDEDSTMFEEYVPGGEHGDGGENADDGAGADETAHESPKEPVARKPRQRRKKLGRSVTLTAGQAKKAVDFFTLLTTFDERSVALAGHIAGTGEDRHEFAIQVLTGKVETPSLGEDIAKVREAQAEEAPIITAMMGAKKIQPMWQAMVHLGADLPHEIPSSEVKAAIRLADVIIHMDDTQETLLAEALRLVA